MRNILLLFSVGIDLLNKPVLLRRIDIDKRSSPGIKTIDLLFRYISHTETIENSLDLTLFAFDMIFYYGQKRPAVDSMQRLDKPSDLRQNDVSASRETGHE